MEQTSSPTLNGMRSPEEFMPLMEAFISSLAKCSCRSTKLRPRRSLRASEQAAQKSLNFEMSTFGGMLIMPKNCGMDLGKSMPNATNIARSNAVNKTACPGRARQSLKSMIVLENVYEIKNKMACIIRIVTVPAACRSRKRLACIGVNGDSQVSIVSACARRPRNVIFTLMRIESKRRLARKTNTGMMVMIGTWPNRCSRDITLSDINRRHHDNLCT
mmetsp:Transcript_58264/g.169133  ORF Transcript_58264/g.169133 Transcript_58264/m.169133 type:complete len:217 (+) Transcript_58264:460-1110(+)